VHISESEHNITKIETKKNFTILGFIPFNKASLLQTESTGRVLN
jgi:hypothetical protein